MVLIPAGAAARAAAPAVAEEEGSQAVELALVVPAVVLLVVLVVHAGILGADIVTAQGIAREAARTAAVGPDAEVRDAVREVAGDRIAGLQIEPPDHRRAPGELVEVTVRLSSSAFRPFGAEAEVPARAVMRVEDR